MGGSHQDTPWWFVAGTLAVLIGGWFAGEGVRSKHWPTVEGVVTKSTIFAGLRPEGDWDDSRRSYYPVVEYRYSVDGVSYTGTNITLPIGFSVLGEGTYRNNALVVAERYPVGGSVLVFHKPSDPSVAVLEPGPSSEAVGLVMAGLATLGVGAFRKAR